MTLLKHAIRTLWFGWLQLGENLQEFKQFATIFAIRIVHGEKNSFLGFLKVSLKLILRYTKSLALSVEKKID